MLNVVCLAAMAATTSLALFLLLRLAAGIASAFSLIFSSALVLDRLATTRRTGLSALHFSGVGVGIALSAVVVALLGDWRNIWLASAGLAALAAVAVALTVPTDAAAAAAADANHRARISRLFAVIDMDTRDDH